MRTKRAGRAVRQIIGFSLGKTGAHGEDRRRTPVGCGYGTVFKSSGSAIRSTVPARRRREFIGHVAEPKAHVKSSGSASPELAAQVKAEAARRRVSLKTLFEEVWSAWPLTCSDTTVPYNRERN
jgi:hypothetical protein